MEKVTNVKQVTNFSLSGCKYMFTKPLSLNFVEKEDNQGFLAVCQYYDKFFVGAGETEERAQYDWETQFHYFYCRMKTSNDIADQLKELFDKDVNTDEVFCGTPIVLKKSGVVLEILRNDRIPSFIQWDGDSDREPVPDYQFVHPELLLCNIGDRITATVEYDAQTKNLNRILFVKKETV